MTYRHLLLFVACLTVSAVTKAQDSLGTHVTYDLEAEMAVGTGSFTAFQLTANRYHALSTRPNTAYLRGAVNVAHRFTKDFSLSGAVDVIGTVHGDHKVYLQQAFANLSYKSFFLEVGSRELQPVLRDKLLSTGSFAKGINAKPIPQIHLGTNGFWTVPYTKKWLQISFDLGYGRFMDDNFHENHFNMKESGNKRYTTGTYYHQKHLYLRSNPEKKIFIAAGLEHVAQFGGTRYSYVDGVLTGKKKPADLDAFWKILVKSGDKQYFENSSMEDWVYGNHLGILMAQIGWNINKDHLLQAYVDNPFDDGSGMRKGNGWDGLWGLQYDNKALGRQYVRKAILEYFQSTNQSGPLHWDRGDYPKPIRDQITDIVTGKDDYYKHSFYDDYAYHGMTPGNPLIPSPIYNEDGYLQYRDNRIKAWHLGVMGELTERLSYLLKGSYSEGWGTYDKPLPGKHHSFDAMIQGQYHIGPWQFSAAYAFDKGNIFGDCSTFNIKIGYHGKIL